MSSKALLSPSEVALAKKLKGKAIVSSIPEEKGADILLYTNKGLAGLQRKEVPNDFILSFTDGRMARAVALLTQNCKFTRIIAEGRFKFWPDGRLVTGKINPKTRKPEPSRFTRRHIRGMLHDLQFVMGVVVDWTEDIDDTVSYILDLPEFINSDKHLGLYTRPSAKGTWYIPSAKDIQLWLLQSFPGIGPATADNIIERFGGDMPLRWTCTQEELASVQGLSKKRAQEMWETLSTVNQSVVGVKSPAVSTIDRLRSMIGK